MDEVTPDSMSFESVFGRTFSLSNRLLTEAQVSGEFTTIPFLGYVPTATQLAELNFEEVSENV